jgi:hypothetical protein
MHYTDFSREWGSNCLKPTSSHGAVKPAVRRAQADLPSGAAPSRVHHLWGVE